MFKFIQTCSTEFTVHSAGLSVNSVSLSAKSAGWGFHCLILNQIDFDRFSLNSADFLVSAGFLNTGWDGLDLRMPLLIRGFGYAQMHKGNLDHLFKDLWLARIKKKTLPCVPFKPLDFFL
jgi:hypothetical protein